MNKIRVAKLYKNYDEVGTATEHIVMKKLLCDLKKRRPYSYFEILPKTCKLYFDIENIPIENENLIKKIITDLQTYITTVIPITEELLEYVLTKNSNSTRHIGLSYHLIFYKIAMDKKDISNLVKIFLLEEKYREYQKYLDLHAYEHNQLFRLPYQKNINPNTNQTNLENDYHKIVYGELKDSIIQETNECRFFRPQFGKICQTIRNSKRFYSKEYGAKNCENHTIIIIAIELFIVILILLFI